jgi:uncharacterized protein YjeT (DUF2065 family)
MTNDEAMAFAGIVMVAVGFIILFLIGQNNDK